MCTHLEKKEKKKKSSCHKRTTDFTDLYRGMRFLPEAEVRYSCYIILQHAYTHKKQTKKPQQRSVPNMTLTQ